MKATITVHRGTLTYTVSIFDENGNRIHSDWCSSYTGAERVAKEYGASITNKED